MKNIIVTEITGTEGTTDENAVHHKYEKLTLRLIEKGISITTMESCTSGLTASLITDTEGASSVFKGSFVTYSNEAKIRAGVPKNIIEESGVYSSQTAAAMAEAAQNCFKTDIAVGVTGTFGNPDTENPDSRPGEVYFSVISATGTSNFRCIVPKQPTRFAYKLYISDVIADQLLELLK